MYTGGQTITVTFAAGTIGHFGPELRGFILEQYHQSQVTIARLLAQLRAIGNDISKRQIVRLLNCGQAGFFREARGVLGAGPTYAACINVDDIGARHKAANGVCTQIGTTIGRSGRPEGLGERVETLQAISSG